jgi:hypothetical protein
MPTTAVSDWGDAMLTSLSAAFILFFSAIPKILGFALIVIVGWFVATLIEKALAGLLRSIRFNELAQRSGLAEFVARMGMNTDSAGMIGLVVKWFIRLIALVVAFDALGLPAVSDVLRQLLLWLPNVIVALVVLVIGGLAARGLSNLVRGTASEAGLTNANLLAKVASGLVWAFAIVVAVNQIGIATTLVNTLFMAIVGSIALAVGLAFGLGGRDTASEIVRNWYEKSKNAPAMVPRETPAASPRAEAMDRATTETVENDPTSWPTGPYPRAGGMGGNPADKKHPAEGG